MLPDFLYAGLTFPEDTLEQHLTAAGALVPEELMSASGWGPEISECIDQGYHHLWMNTLQDVGLWAEEAGRDAELPAEFWVRIAAAASGMEFPEFMPYCLGKAQGWPKQDPADVMAAFATLPDVAGMSRQLHEATGRVAQVLRKDSREAGAMLDRGDLTGLSEHLRSGAYDRVGPKVSEPFSDAFDGLFELVTAKSFPEEHRAHAWAVIGGNPFKVVLGDGLMPLTYAEVWWRAG